MKQILPLLMMLFVWLGTCTSQELERGGSLGARIGVPDQGAGVLVQQVLPGGTADNIGLKANDVLEKVNGTLIEDPNALVAMTRSWRAGQSITVSLRRNDIPQTIKGLVKGKPIEEPAAGTIKYGSIAYDGGQLRSILNLPEGSNRPPVVFFLQGFGCSSIDYYYSPSNPIRQLVEGWVSAGFAVFRVEKPGMGDCKGLPDCAEIGYNYEVEAFKTSLRQLKQNTAIDPEQIFLFGHSLGGITAPLLAADTKVKGIINYGSVATTWYEYLLKVLREQEAISGTDYATIEANVRARTPLLHAYLVEKQTPDQLAANPDFEPLLSSGLPVRDGNYMLSRHYSFMQQINDANIVAAFQKADCHLFALHGEFDLHAVDAEWAEQSAAVVNSFAPGKGSWKVLPETEHGFAIVPTMEEYVNMRQDGRFNGRYMEEHFNPKMVEETVQWMRSVM